MTIRFGSVALAGLPNVGKSTLLNDLIGTRLSMVAARPQATRHPVTGLLTEGDVQIELHDLPGLLDPEYTLHQSMREMALEVLGKVDLVLHLHPAPIAPAPPLVTLVPDLDRSLPPVVVVYTKGDQATPERRAALGQDAIVVSRDDPASRARLVAAIAARLPEQPFRHPADEVGTQPVRFFVGEYLREAAFELLEDELPYSIAVEVDEYREGRSPVYIRATLFVERESQKGIVIGKGGATLREIGSRARRRIEELIGEPVYLETWVKVLARWRRSATSLTRFGFPVPETRKD